MARTGKLSAVEVTKAKGPAVLHDGGGLYLRVSPAGAKSWVFRFQLDRKRRDMGLGPSPDIPLADARGKAAEHRKLRHEGIDPLVAKAAQRQGTSKSWRLLRPHADQVGLWYHELVNAIVLPQSILDLGPSRYVFGLGCVHQQLRYLR